MSKHKPTKGKQGFASNPNNINRGGRPKGSRNKSSLVKSQLRIDSITTEAVDLLHALMVNDKEALGITSDVPLSIRKDSAKEIINKAIANEKDKKPVTFKKKEDEEDEEVEVRPLFSATPVKRTSNG